jgi:hypothetical protein
MNHNERQKDGTERRGNCWWLGQTESEIRIEEGTEEDKENANKRHKHRHKEQTRTTKTTGDCGRKMWTVVFSLLIINNKQSWLIRSTAKVSSSPSSLPPTTWWWPWELGPLLMKRAIIVARAWAPGYQPQGTLATNWTGSLACLVTVLLQTNPTHATPAACGRVHVHALSRTLTHCQCNRDENTLICFALEIVDLLYCKYTLLYGLCAEYTNRRGVVRFEVFTAVTMKHAVFWDIKTQFVPHRKHITSLL